LGFSSTHERKSKTYVLVKKGCIYLRHNSISEDIPIVLALKAMGIQSDYEILLLVAGTDMVYQDTFSINFEECSRLKVFTQQQALDYIGTRTKKTRQSIAAKRTPAREAMEALATIILAHVPVENLNFRPKALYMAFMTRRVLQAMANPALVDDRDYVGNKRLEL
jgi:DNA-directed RNA polymerase III subunit RPC2